MQNTKKQILSHSNSFLYLFCILSNSSKIHFNYLHVIRKIDAWASEGEGRGGLPPLDFESISKKRLFFQFRGVKNKFHHFWPPPGKILGKSPTGSPLEKSLRRLWIDA